MIEGVKKQEVFYIKSGRTTLFLRQQEIANHKAVTNLVVDTAQISWRQTLLLLENFMRRFFEPRLILTLDLDQQKALADWLLEQGYQKTDHGYEKELHYCTALVLGGGGAHGAYQIGVWKSLIENRIEIDLVTGASVGALNGALFLQGDCQAGIEMWEKIETDQVLQVSMEKIEEVDVHAELQRIRSFAGEILKQRGVSSEPLRQLLKEHLVEPLPEKPPLYIVTVQLPSFQEVILRVQDYHGEELLDWLMASCSVFPVMSKQVINGVSYIDGGYRNNMPADVAFAKGATECIVVDIQGPGIDRRIRPTEEQIVIRIGSRWSLGNILMFDEFRSKQNIALGYLEAQKAFGKLQGSWYTFPKEADFKTLTRSFNRYVQERLTNFLQPRKQFAETLAQYFGERVPLEKYTLQLLEQWGRWTMIQPTKCYEILEVWGLIQKAIIDAFPEDPQYTLEEKIALSLAKRTVFSNYNQTLQIYLQLQRGTDLSEQFRSNPMITLLALFLDFMVEGHYGRI